MGSSVRGRARSPQSGVGATWHRDPEPERRPRSLGATRTGLPSAGAGRTKGGSTMLRSLVPADAPSSSSPGPSSSPSVPRRSSPAVGSSARTARSTSCGRRRSRAITTASSTTSPRSSSRAAAARSAASRPSPGSRRASRRAATGPSSGSSARPTRSPTAASSVAAAARPRERAEVLMEVTDRRARHHGPARRRRGSRPWATDHGFRLPPDAPEVLEFYAERSPIFLAAVVRRRRRRGTRPERR